MPAWTFVGTASDIWAANLEPHFIDVSAQTWMLDPERVRRRDNLRDVAAVIVVSAFGAPVDTQAWDGFSLETGIPVIIDGAAAFDTVATAPTARPQISDMISLHATKIFGIGEGGLVMSTDEALVHRVRQNCNFGIWGSPEGQILGYNGKLSENHAAVGLATLDGWDQQRRSFEQLTQKYVAGLKVFSGLTTLPSFATVGFRVIATSLSTTIARRSSIY